MGGGTSLHGFDFDLLLSKTVIAINDAFLRIPCAGVVSVDTHWMRERREALDAFTGHKFLIVSDDTDLSTIPEGTHLRCGYEPGLSDRPDLINVQGNSGYAALGVAYALRAKRIYLLGYDFYEHQSHWFDNYEWSSGASDRTYRHWAHAFGTMSMQLTAAGIRVINVGERSRITAFPKISLCSFALQCRQEL